MTDEFMERVRRAKGGELVAASQEEIEALRKVLPALEGGYCTCGEPCPTCGKPKQPAVFLIAD